MTPPWEEVDEAPRFFEPTDCDWLTVPAPVSKTVQYAGPAAPKSTGSAGQLFRIAKKTNIVAEAIKIDFALLLIMASP
jgi:hypothetical protein